MKVDFISMNELQMCFQFLTAIRFFNEEMLPTTNLCAKQAKEGNFTAVTLDELIHIFGLIYFVNMQKLPEYRMY